LQECTACKRHGAPLCGEKISQFFSHKSARHVNFLDKLDAPTYGMTFCDLRTASLRVTGAHEAAWQGAGMLAV